jgi:hypothetical protein
MGFTIFVSIKGTTTMVDITESTTGALLRALVAERFPNDDIAKTIFTLDSHTMEENSTLVSQGVASGSILVCQQTSYTMFELLPMMTAGIRPFNVPHARILPDGQRGTSNRLRF